MADLIDFRDKSFVEQLSILDALETGARLETLPDLLDLYRSHLGDDGVDQAVADTLRALLPAYEGAVRQGLTDGDPRVRRLCAQVVGRRGLGALAGDVAVSARQEAAPGLLLDCLSALAKLSPAEHLDVFHAYLEHADPLIAALCVETLGENRDLDAAATFQEMVSRAEDDDRYQHCDLTTSKAIGALEALGTAETIQFLVSKIHHRNPNARRLIIESLTRLGPPVIPHLGPIFDGDQVDDMIMAANVIGFIGDKSGGDILVHALDRGKAQHANVRCAVYEALGRIPSLKGLICLLDGLGEEDEMLLQAVVTALDPQVNPGIAGKVIEHLGRGDEEAGRILRAVIAAKATHLFRILYADESVAGRVIDALDVSKDTETREVFRGVLQEIGGDRAGAALARLDAGADNAGHHRVLVADDSKSMLMFYRAVGSQMDLEVLTAENGRVALDRIERGEAFHLVVTDLNMPVMDGVQLTHRIREGGVLLRGADPDGHHRVRGIPGGPGPQRRGHRVHPETPDPRGFRGKDPRTTGLTPTLHQPRSEAARICSGRPLCFSWRLL